MIVFLLAAALTCPGQTVPIEASQPDGEGRIQYQLRLPEQPFRINSGTDSRQTWCVYLPGGVRIKRVRTFVGWDRGSLGELVLTVTAGSFIVASRSEHKEALSNYDSMKTEDVDYLTAGETPLAVYVVARTTNGQWTRAEVGVIVEVGR